MKKRILFSLFILCSFLFVKNTWARSFIEEKENAYKFKIYIPSSKMSMIHSFIKITDEEGKAYYDVSPKVTLFEDLDDYVEKPANFDIDMLQKFSKITYFGYGYQEQKEDVYYYATQYLLYKTFSDINASVLFEDQNSNYLDPYLAEIEKNIETVSFSLEDFTTTKDTYEITDSYIVDNFTVEGDHIKVSSENNKIIVHFLEEQENYLLHFYPKNICENITIWTTMNIKLFSRREVCEKEYSVAVTYQKEELNNQEPPIVEDDNSIQDNQESATSTPNEQDKNNIEENPKVEEKQEIELEETENTDKNSIEVPVPSTYKNQFPFLNLWYFIGVLYYVFKK